MDKKADERVVRKTANAIDAAYAHLSHLSKDDYDQFAKGFRLDTPQEVVDRLAAATMHARLFVEELRMIVEKDDGTTISDEKDTHPTDQVARH